MNLKHNQRIIFWDNIKFLLIALVVIGHFVEFLVDSYDSFKSLYLFIYAFHMPLFIFVSGLFFKPKNISNKCLMYVSIGFVLKILLFVEMNAIGIKTNFMLLAGSDVSWFMFSLAIFTLVTYLLRNKNKKFILIFSLLIACFVGYDKEIGDFLYLSRSIIFFPFFFLGTMLKQEKIIQLKEKYNKKLLIPSILIIFIWAMICLFYLDPIYNLRHLFTGRNPFSKIVYNYGPLVRMLCYFISAILSIAIISLVPNKNTLNVSKIGVKTLQIYFWHLPLLYILFYFIDFKSMCETIFGKIICLEIVIIIVFILSHKIFAFPTKNIIKYNKK